MFLVSHQRLHGSDPRSGGSQLAAAEDGDAPNDSHSVHETFKESRQIKNGLNFATRDLVTLENSDK